MTREQEKAQAAFAQKIAALLTYEARMKDHEAACWLGLRKNIEEAAANVHSALDGVLDKTLDNVRAMQEQFRRESPA